MAKCKQTAEEFIQNTFSPHVAVLCSAEAEVLCQKNNLTFVQLVQPFCRLATEVHTRDPNNLPHVIRNLRLNVCDMTNPGYPTQPAAIRKLLNDAVANTQLPSRDGGKSNVTSVGNYDLQLNSSTPWFESYREMFLKIMPPSDHEYLNNCLGCIFVVSSSHADPVATFQSLANQQLQQQQQFPNKTPRWFCQGILHYFVLLHDVIEGEQARAESIYQMMKSTFPPTCCHLLQINSRSLQAVDTMRSEASLPDPWSQFIPKPVEPQIQYSHKPRYFIAWEGVDYDYAETDDTAFPSRLSEGPEIVDDSIMTSSLEFDDKTNLVPGMSDSIPNLSNPLMDHPLAFSSNDLRDPLSGPNSPDGDPTAAANGYQDGRSTTPGTSDKTKSRVHGICLTTSDMDRLRIFMHEFVVKALVPWAERQMRIFSEQLTSRKGIHRSIFSATKKWFGGNKPSGYVPSNQNTTVVYTSDAPELQLRRMADLAFLFQMFEFAYQTYHTAKRDFNNDHAWLHLAGTLEMASLSIFMQGNQAQRPYPHHYMESAITTYIATCRNPQFATRATLTSTDALKSRGMFREAAMQFLKLTNEDSDLSSALFLEQAAHCFINMKVPLVRKYSFHIILAGHRFNKSVQRKHALRSYSQALQIYKSKHWSLAEDHIHFTIGRQSFNLKQLENATAAFKHLLGEDSLQVPTQQGSFLREYLFVYKQLLSQEAGENSSYGRLPELPLPNVNANATKVLLGKKSTPSENVRKTPASGIWFDEDPANVTVWQKLEENLVKSANHGSLSAMFQQTIQCFTNHTENKYSPTGFVGEPITVEVNVENPLQVTLVLSEVMLLWSFLPCIAGTDKPQLISNEISTGVKNNLADEIIQTAVIKEVVLQGKESQPIHLTLVPRQPGELRIVGLAYNLGTTPQQPVVTLPGESNKSSYFSSVFVRGKQRLEVQGPRLNNTKEDKVNKAYGPDRRLDLVIQEEMPILQVNFCDFPDALLCGEVHCIEIEFTNCGRSPLRTLKLTTSHPEFCTFGVGSDLPKYPYVYQQRSSKTDTSMCDKIDKKDFFNVSNVLDILLSDNVLKPGETISLPMWLRGNDIGGVHEVDFLFYYEPLTHQSKIKYRILRHRAIINTVESLSVHVSAFQSSACVSRNSGEELNSCTISCELENLSQVQIQRPHIQELQITQVSCVSPVWQISSLSTCDQKGIRIGSRECLQLVLKGTKSNQRNGGNLLISEVPFDIEQVNSVSTPCCDFYCRSQIWHETRRKQDTAGDKDRQFEMLNQALNVKMILICLWKAFVAQENGQMKILVGQHHIHLETVNNVVTSYPLVLASSDQTQLKFIREIEPENEVKPRPEVTTKLVSYSFLYKTSIKHDFNSGLCIVPVSLKLQNHSGVKLDILIDTCQVTDRLKAVQTTDGSQAHLIPISTSFNWVGQTLAQVSLDVGESKQVPLRAGFCRPGMYNLNNLAVFVTYMKDQSEMIQQNHVTPNVLTLIDLFET
ncbi:trafficking protein particle complex subunit 8 isoform X1 [Patella vulgata]|uniref:trafficking protein particle complex subunit 8 isoform X1 n=1 Tax=Patella vulgata TaxID=6465 RepID=UPI00217F5078|nr:trafficking protein particle complex subunit 8 isoform X1 [Patella vulgata]